MADFDTAKLLGVIGSIMVIVGYILPIFAVVGLILIGLSLRYLSNTFKDASISRYATYFLGLLILAIIIALVSSVLIVLFMIISPIVASSGTASLEEFVSVALASFMLAVILLILLVLASSIVGFIGFYFLYKSLTRLSEVSGERLFRLSGLAIVIGYVALIFGLLTAIILVGFLLIIGGAIAFLVGFNLLAVAFYSIRPPQAQPLSTSVTT
ncbi:MAG: DUF996 domain-containing protein [Acidilobaceae archaeon]